MKSKDEMQAQWEERLKTEGLAPLETTYRRMTENGPHTYTKIEPQHTVGLSDYYAKCQEFTEQLEIRLAIWRLYSSGESLLRIAKATGKPLGTVLNRIRKTRREMVFYLASIPGKKVPPEARRTADILEVFVEAEQRKRKG